MIITKLKRCTKCRIELPLNRFYTSKISSDKYTPHCSECHNKLTKLNYEKVKSDPVLYFKLKLQNSESKKRCSDRKKINN